MSDPWVTATQTWLNETYTGVPGWSPVPVTGKTSWTTMFALTRALQYELGLASLSDTFGPGTLAALQARAEIGPLTSNTNIIRIVQGGMYCKGYNGGDGLLDGVYSPTTVGGIQEMRLDIGLSSGAGTVSPKVFKALLSMDAYVLVSGGSSTIRSIQRDLNGRYLARNDFYVIPADGYYSRDVQRGLMYALQYEIGMPDGVANGNFGPGTQSGITTQANFGVGDSDVATGKFFIHLYQAALNFNGYTTPYTGVFTGATQSITTSFQTFCVLSTSGRSDFRTWASLLVSTGDVNRPGKAADTIRQITNARAVSLISNGYETIGRYLTNTPVADPLDKNIKPGELAAIFAAGLTVFPIFQEGGDSTSYFGYNNGYKAGQRAHDAAWAYGFKAETPIYFAVDFDALEEEVYDYVVPHFRGIIDGLGSRVSGYRVGVYGSRNTCSIISSRGLAELSFVSGMSTGFSGNLGYPLPVNWAFDQVLEYEIGTGAGWVNIDKNIKSGRDLGQSSIVANIVPQPMTEPEKAIAYVFTVQGTAVEYVATVDDGIDSSDLTARYLRRRHYAGPDWTLLGGINSSDFNLYANTEIPASSVPLAFSTIPATEVDGLDWPHMLATASVYLNRGPSMSLVGPEFSDIGGWGGDLATLAADYFYRSTSTVDAYTFSSQALSGVIESTFGPADLKSDVYAWVASHTFSTNPSLTFAEAIRRAVTDSTYSGENSFDSFIRLRWGSVSNGKNIVEQVFDQPGDTTDRILFNSARTWLLQNYEDRDPLFLSDFSSADLKSIAKALTNEIATRSNSYSPLP